jgi:transcriptional regulator with XRE-family HTH domain
MAVRRARRAKGLSLEIAAGRVGRTKGWLSKIENGRLPLDKRSDIGALADALEVSADALLGEPAPEVQAGRRSLNLNPLRSALLDSAPDDPPDMGARPVAVLAELNDQADAALRVSDWDALLPLLPTLIGELEVHAASGGSSRDEALRLLVPATANAVITLRYANQPDLAWVAAERGRQAAALLGDPVWEGAAAFGAAHARSSANRPRALMTTPQAADRMDAHAGQGGMALEVLVMLRLSAALARAVQGDHDGAADQGAEAMRLASRMEDRADAWELAGPSNARVWLASLAVEAGNAGQALAHADKVDPRALASNNRRAALRIESARAHAMLGRHSDAVRALKTAERLSPDQVRNSPLIRDLVAFMIDQAPGNDLRGLAWRMGVI